MSTGKRLAKRSILGTRVCAPAEDGRYLTGVIRDTKTSMDGRETIYTVMIDVDKTNPITTTSSSTTTTTTPTPIPTSNNSSNNMTTVAKKVCREYRGSELIGPGFESISIAKLSTGQRVYITYNGREVPGIVDYHNQYTEEVFLTVEVPNGQPPVKVRRRLDDLRLMESRKSARLLQQEMDTDYSRFAIEGQTEPMNRRRTSSMSSSVSSSSCSIDVPAVQTGRKRRPSDSSDDVMDDCMAAMVLMSLSCSPKSPRLPQGAFSHSWTSGSSWDSLMSSTSSTASRTTTPSPPIHQQNKQQPLLRASVRDALNPGSGGKIDRTSPSNVDEGIEMDESVGFGMDDGPVKNKCTRRILFQCTWPGCGQQYDLCHQVENHVRAQHLGRTDLNGESSDHEEEFYYTEIEIDERATSSSSSSGSPHSPSSPSASNDGSTISACQSPVLSNLAFTFFASSSAPTWSHLDMVKPPHEDPEYQKMLHQKEMMRSKQQQQQQKQESLYSSPINIPGGGSFAHQYNMASGHQHAASAPVSSHHLPKINNHKYMRLNSNSKASGTGTCGTTMLQSPNKTTSSPNKRVRGESRKCRKVYGMENRDSWCTQCKWKKACSRFVD